MDEDLSLLLITDGLHWIDGRSRIDFWCNSFFPTVQNNAQAVREILQVNTLWKRPKLIQVPGSYDTIFQVS